jgi:hypothetical protein
MQRNVGRSLVGDHDVGACALDWSVYPEIVEDILREVDVDARSVFLGERRGKNAGAVEVLLQVGAECVGSFG